MTTLHAQPYDISATGFYFNLLDEYTARAGELRNEAGSPVEEFMIEFIDGEDGDAELFKACEINQTNLSTWFEEIEPMDDDVKVQLFYMMDNNICADLDEAIKKADQEKYSIFDGEMDEAATELFDECYLYEVPVHLRNYIDYKQFSYDMRCNGDLVEFNFAGRTYTCTNANQ